MVEDIFAFLPAYGDHVEKITERANVSGWRESHQFLMKSLSYVYVDILRFCHDSCQLFSHKRSGTYHCDTGSD